MMPSLVYLELDSALRYTAIFADVACCISYNAHQQVDLGRYVVTHSNTSDIKVKTSWLEYMRRWYPSSVTKRNTALALNYFDCF